MPTEETREEFIGGTAVRKMDITAHTTADGLLAVLTVDLGDEGRFSHLTDVNLIERIALHLSRAADDMRHRAGRP